MSKGFSFAVWYEGWLLKDIFQMRWILCKVPSPHDYVLIRSGNALWYCVKKTRTEFSCMHFWFSVCFSNFDLWEMFFFSSSWVREKFLPTSTLIKLSLLLRSWWVTQIGIHLLKGLCMFEMCSFSCVHKFSFSNIKALNLPSQIPEKTKHI